MRYDKQLLADEAPEVQRALRPLIRETTGAIGNIAHRGITIVDGLSADPGYPMALSDGPSRGLFPRKQVVRVVSPKIIADRNLEGYQSLKVVKATTKVSERRHYTPFANGPGEAGARTLPFSRLPRVVSIGLSSREDLSVEFEGSLATNGDVSVGPFGVSIELRGPRIREFYGQPDAQTEYRRAFSERLAIAALVAHGLNAYDAKIDTSEVTELYDAWQLVGEPIEAAEASAAPMWTRTTNAALQHDLLRPEK